MQVRIYHFLYLFKCRSFQSCERMRTTMTTRFPGHIRRKLYVHAISTKNSVMFIFFHHAAPSLFCLLAALAGAPQVFFAASKENALNTEGEKPKRQQMVFEVARGDAQQLQAIAESTGHRYAYLVRPKFRIPLRTYRLIL